MRRMKEILFYVSASAVLLGGGFWSCGNSDAIRGLDDIFGGIIGTIVAQFI